MARQRRPAKSMPVEQPQSLLSRAIRAISDWRVIVGAIVGVFVFGGTVYAFVGKFATKAELAPVSAHLQEHDVEFAGFKQALEDIRETVHQIHDDQRLQSSPHR